MEENNYFMSEGLQGNKNFKETRIWIYISLHYIYTVYVIFKSLLIILMFNLKCYLVTNNKRYQ